MRRGGGSVVCYSESGFIAVKDLGGGGWGNTRGVFFRWPMLRGWLFHLESENSNPVGDSNTVRNTNTVVTQTPWLGPLNRLRFSFLSSGRYLK